jgi:phosphoenolpyruvate carboxykinase (ATP)
MDLVTRYPGKVRFFQYNTGGVGEILDQKIVGGKKVKTMIRKVERVPIDLMAAIQRGDLRGTNSYEDGRLGTKEIARVEGFDLSPYNVEKLYDKEKIDWFVQDLVEGRREFTEEIAAEGLKPEIRKAAEQSFNIARGGSRTQVAPFPVEIDRPTPGESKPMPDYFKDYEPVRRPRRPSTGRHW